MKKLLISLVILSAFYLVGAVVEWNLNPAAWLRVTRFVALTGAGFAVLFYPYESKEQ